MGLQRINQERIIKIKFYLEKGDLLSKSRIAYLTGYNYFVVEQIMEYLVETGDVIQVDKKYKLKVKK